MRSLLLGIDTGGTYTDAVLVDPEAAVGTQVLATAKALTTRHDLAIGIGESLDSVLAQSNALSDEIKLCSISTTLATNALVEGHGGRVCLVAVGFSDADLQRAGLAEALGNDYVVQLSGGHNAYGLETAELDLSSFEHQIKALDSEPAGFAVVAQFGVRNPSHEIAVREALGEITDAPVTCSHELTAKLNGPRRALTSLLNARLIPLIGSLMKAAGDLLAERKIDAPLMVVRGDGTLLGVDVARNRPIETILSGPAASVIGASFLTDAPNAIVSDIGGTTTDIAILVDGKPRLDTEGATVGGHRTMVEAVAMETFGLGGDSKVSVHDNGPQTHLELGPQRVVPLCILATQFPDVVLPTLEREALSELGRERDGQFAYVARPDAIVEQDERTSQIMDALASGPVALNDLLPTKRHELTLDRLVRTGVVLRSGFTPSDACHVLGLHTEFSVPAALLGAKLFGRQQDRRGERVNEDPQDLSQKVVDLVVRRTAELILGAAMTSDGLQKPGSGELALDVLAQAGLNGHSQTMAISLALQVPVVGLGASAKTYYPAVGTLLGTEAVISEHAGVANAVGAVVGQVAITQRAVVTPLKNGLFRAHVSEQKDFETVDEAADYSIDALSAVAVTAAVEAGAVDPRVEVERDDKWINSNGGKLFVESNISVVASGRPRLG